MLIGMIFALFFIFINFVIDKRRLTPVIVFNTLWFIVLFINKLNYFEFYTFGQKSILLIVIGLIVFNLTYLCCKYFDTSKPYNKKQCMCTLRENHREEISVKRFLVIQCVVTFFLLILFFRMLPNLKNGGLLAIRTIYTSNINFMTTFERYFYIHFVIFPLNSCILILAIIWLFKDIIKIQHAIPSFINTLLIALITGGRMALFDLGIYLILACVICRKDIKKPILKKKKRIVYILLLCIFVYIIINTIERSSSSEKSFLDSIIMYFVGGMKVFDITLQNVFEFGLNDYMYGGCFIAGILSFILTFVQYIPIIGLMVKVMPTTTAQMFLNSNIRISSTISMNAFATMYYYFMRDFGIAGIVILTSLFSIACYFIYRRTKKNTLTINVFFAIKLFVVIIYSSCWWEPYRMEFWTSLLHLFWVMPLVKLRRKEQ